MKRLVVTKKELWTIPNILTFIRILSVPVYMTLIILGGLDFGHYTQYPQWYVYVGLGVMVFAAATDLFDGMIARKFNQGTYAGQLLDPIADKCMHIGCVIALIVVGYLHWAFVIFLVFRELCMIVVGSFIFNDVNVKSNMLGKVASAILSIGMIASFFHPYVKQLWGDYGIDWIIITVGLILNWAAAINYGVDAAKQYKYNKEHGLLGKDPEIVEPDEQKEEPAPEEQTEEEKEEN